VRFSAIAWSFLHTFSWPAFISFTLLLVAVLLVSKILAGLCVTRWAWAIEARERGKREMRAREKEREREREAGCMGMGGDAGGMSKSHTPMR